jgi:hypothetical protein
MIGSILVSGADSDGSYWVYTPDNNNGLGPQNSWRPTIAGSPVLVFGKFLVTGAQLNGLTTSGDFGDDGKIASNYPIATLVSSSGIARFCRTVIIGDMAPRRAPNSTGSFWFQAPVGIANGTYTVQVSASGLGLDSTNTPVQLTLPATDMGPALEVALSAPLI